MGDDLLRLQKSYDGDASELASKRRSKIPAKLEICMSPNTADAKGRLIGFFSLDFPPNPVMPCLTNRKVRSLAKKVSPSDGKRWNLLDMWGRSC